MVAFIMAGLVPAVTTSANALLELKKLFAHLAKLKKKQGILFIY